jgi:DNA-binding NarL/FixJ family response regulator
MVRYQLLGAVSSEVELAIALHRHRPDVVVMDYALTRGDGLSACFRLKQRRHAPGVVLYSAYVDDVFAVPATLAQADAIVSKNDPVEVLLAAIDAAATGASQVPPPDPELIEAASARLDADDLPIVGMLFARMRVGGIASTLGVEPRDVRSRALRIIGQMQAHDRRQGHAAV